MKIPLFIIVSILFIASIISIAGCSFSLTDKRGGEYSLTREDKELKDPVIIERCSVPTGFACIDYSADEEGVYVTLKNSMPADTKDFYIAFYCGKSDPTDMANGAMKQFRVPCALKKDSQFDSELIITYTDIFSSLTHTKKGRLMARVR